MEEAPDEGQRVGSAALYLERRALRSQVRGTLSQPGIRTAIAPSLVCLPFFVCRFDLHPTMRYKASVWSVDDWCGAGGN